MKNFKCQNINCGVSFKAEELGPCPVCGCEITKEEKSSPLKIILVLVILISGAAASYIFLSPEMQSKKIAETEENNEISNVQIEADYKDKCNSDVRLKKPKISKINKSLIVELASSSYNCYFKYQLNKSKIQDSNLFIIEEEFEKIKLFKVSVYTDEDSLLVNESFKNPYFEKVNNDKDFEKYLEDFNNTFKTHLRELKENQESDYGTKLVSIFVKKLGMDADVTKINVLNDKKNTNISLNRLLNDLENDAFSDIYYKAKLNVDSEKSSGKTKIKKIKITLNKI